MYFDIITIFPKIFDSYFSESILKRAQDKKKIKIYFHNLRDYSSDKHKTVDDRPYGGGPGMLLKVEPIYKAVKDIKSKSKGKKIRTILLSPKGEIFNQKIASRLSKFDKLIFICGRYEGVDERICKHLIDEEISLGEFVISGGELAAMVIIETVSRLIPGVLGKKESVQEETFFKKGYIKYPQYSRPENFRGWKVPKILLSGNHKKIERWRKKHSSGLKANFKKV